MENTSHRVVSTHFDAPKEETETYEFNFYFSQD